jgi:putative FmdB family regulatory protein
MPIYEYQCQKCGTHIEKRQSISEEPLTECEKCGGKLEKQISLSGFQFKGAGWYVTDYAAKKSPSADKADTGEKPSASEKTEKTSSGESTAKTDTASNTKSDAPAAPKADTSAKKD